MKSRVVHISSLSLLLVGTLSLPAIAGGASAYVENDFSVRNIYDGRSETRVKIDSLYTFDRRAISNSVKQGSSFTLTKQSASGDVGGFWIDQSFKEIDNFNIYANTKIDETGWGKEVKAIRVSDTYSYNGIDKTHRVSTGFSY